MAHANGTPFPAWYNALMVTERGAVRPVSENIRIAIEQAPELSGVMRWDKLRNYTCVAAPLPWGEQFRGLRQWTDDDDLELSCWLQRNYLFVNKKSVAEVVETVAKKLPIHPVLEYLQKCRWDGEHRLDDWAITYLGTEANDYVRAVAARWMISAVARVHQPGIKADHALVLEGKQGLGKSRALRALGEPWFTDELAALGTKDASEQTVGVWIVELAELDAVRSAADVERVKAFLSRSVDRFRPSYGRRVLEYPRQCVFAATTNADAWSRDETGARRFWPLRCTVVNVDGLYAVRDQLWAEARDRYLADECWHLDNEALVLSAAEEQEARTIEDPWAKDVMRIASGETSISTAEILRLMGVPIERYGRGEAMRIAAILRKAGWTAKKERVGLVVERRFRPRTTV